MAIITYPENTEAAFDRNDIGTNCTEITQQVEKTSHMMQPFSVSKKRLTLEEQQLFFRNSRNFFE